MEKKQMLSSTLRSLTVGSISIKNSRGLYGSSSQIQLPICLCFSYIFTKVSLIVKLLASRLLISFSAQNSMISLAYLFCDFEPPLIFKFILFPLLDYTYIIQKLLPNVNLIGMIKMLLFQQFKNLCYQKR